MKKVLLCVFLGIGFVYLYSMNSTENRQRLVDDTSLNYVAFKHRYTTSLHSYDDKEIARCYAVYNALLDFKYVKDAYNPEVRDSLVKMGLCELDNNALVLKGFFLDDSLKPLLKKSSKKK